MKINIWIRPGEDGKPVMRVDAKYENRDTPVIQHYGRKLMNALEGSAGKADDNG